MKTVVVALLLFIISLSVNAETVVVLGDSISAGYGIDVEKGWVNLLDKKLEGLGDYTVINASISGDTTGAGLARLPALLKKHQPDVVIIELGGNDGLQGFPIRIMKNNISTMVELAQQAHAKVLLLGMRIPPNYGERYTETFFQAYQQIAKERKVALMPFFLNSVAIYKEYMQDDGIHPRANAQAMLLDDMWPYLAPLLELDKSQTN